MANIRPNDLTADATPSSSDVTIVDGLTTRKTTLEQLVNAGRPFASQAEAEAGVDATKAMNPLTTAQAIAAQTAGAFATLAQGTLADTAVQPGALGAAAFSNDYNDLTDKPTLGTAAATDASEYATAAQGAKADSAVQSVLSGIGITIDASDPNNPIVINDGDGSGDMLKAVYDAGGFGADAFGGGVPFATKATAEAYVPPVGNPPDYIRTAGYDAVGDRGGTNYALDVGASSGDLEISDGVSTFYYVVKHDYLTPQMFGAVSGASQTQDAAFLRAFTSAIEDDIPLIINGEFKLDVVDLTGIEAGGNLRVDMRGKLVHVDAASSHLINFGNLALLHIFGGGEVDGQHTLQTSWVSLLECWNTSRLVIEDITVRNIKKIGIRKSNSSNLATVLRRIQFIDGAVHSGTPGEFCEFTQIRGGQYTLVEGCRFIQTANPLANQARNPCGLDYINTGGTVSHGIVQVRNNYFENLGMHAAGNLLSPLDFYSYADKIEITGNRFRKNRISAIRTSSGGIVDIALNDILQDVPQIIDGGAAYAEAALIQPGLVDRGYVTDDNDVATVTVRANKGIINNVNCRAISASAGGEGLSNIYRNLKVEDNCFRSSGSNTQHAIFTNAVRHVTVDGGEIEGFTTAVRVQQTDNIAPLSSEANAKLTMRDILVKNCPIGLYARTNVSNMDIMLDDVTIEGATTFAFTIRDAGKVTIRGGDMGGAAMDTSANDSFVMRDVSGVSGYPVGYTTNTYYRIRDCEGLTDQASA